MKRAFLLFSVLMAFATSGFSQKVEFRQAQTRVIEPMQDVFVRPLVADLQILKEERQTYPVSWQFQNKRISDITVADLQDAKILAAYQAAVQEDADVIVGATFEVRNHEEKGKSSDLGIDIIVRGYPAKYINWHKMGEDSTDKDWVPMLIDGQRARSLGASDAKTGAVNGSSNTQH